MQKPTTTTAMTTQTSISATPATQNENDYKDISAEIENDFLCCQVCYDHYTETEQKAPRVSPCGHTLCFACISAILTTSDPKCPFCKHWYPHSVTDYTFPKNFMVLGMMSFFPKTQGSLNLLQFSHDEKKDIEEKVLETQQDVGYYSALIERQEQHLVRLREQEKAAEERHQLTVARLQDINHNISCITARGMTSSSGTSTATTMGGTATAVVGLTGVPAQLLPHLQPPPPPPRSVPHPLIHQQQQWQQLQQAQLQGQQGQHQWQHEQQAQQQWQRAQEQQQASLLRGGGGAARNTIAHELHNRLTARRRVNQPSVIIPERGGEGEQLQEPVSELQRLFLHRRNGGTIATHT